MNYKSTAAIGACLFLFFNACERPEAPDFSLEHKVQVPLTAEREYQFLGNSNALVDTTSEDFESLFTVGGDGLVTLSKGESFEFGDMDDAIPEVNVNPTGVNSEVGEIELTSFSSSGNVGSADFNTITGLDPNSFSKGQTIPGGSTPNTINIAFDTDYFVSAIIKSGSLEITFTNNLGFDIDQLNLTLNAGNSQIESETFSNFNDADQITWDISFAPGADTELKDLNVDFTASWSGQQMKRDPQSLDVNDVGGNNLIASEVTAVIDAQQLSSSGISDVDDNNFRFDQADHYIELKGGALSITNINNEIDLTIENLQISFPDIRTEPYTPADSLVLNMQIPRNSSGVADITEDLSGVRIYAEGNEVNYNITGTTEDLKASGSSARTISETDSFSASVELSNLTVWKAVGVVAPRNILINNDADSDGSLDLNNDAEAEVISIDGLKTLSEKVDGLEFANPMLSILYNSNIGVETTIYASIAGKSASGEVVYLTGKSGSDNYVNLSEMPGELKENGKTLSRDKLVKFSLSKAVDGTTIKGGELFNKETTNVDDFMNNLPTEVRFIGLAGLNKDSEVGTLIDPVRFEPNMYIDLPLHFSPGTSTFTDTLEADLKDLPGNEANRSLAEATVNIGYNNNLPFDLDLNLILLDEQFQEVTQIPLPNQEATVIRAAQISSNTYFVEKGREGKMAITLDQEQLDVLNRARHMLIKIELSTAEQQEVKVRDEDSISLSIRMNVAIKSDIN